MFFPIICPRRCALLDCAHQRSGPAQPITAPQTEIPMRNCHCSRSQLGSGVAHGRYHQAHPTLAIGHPQTEQPAVHPLVIPLSLSPTTTAAQTNITTCCSRRQKKKKKNHPLSSSSVFVDSPGATSAAASTSDVLSAQLGWLPDTQIRRYDT